MTLGLNELRDSIHKNSVARGFYDGDNELKDLLRDDKLATDIVTHAKFAERIALVHSELSEAIEADRHNRWANLREINLDFRSNMPIGQSSKELFEKEVKNTVEDELADALIRILDMCGWLNIDIEKHTELKMKYNVGREYKHGKSY